MIANLLALEPVRTLHHGSKPDRAEVEAAVAHFLAYYREHMLDNTTTYPGVREGLALLEGHAA